MKTIILLITTIFVGFASMSAQVWCAPGAVWQYYIHGSFPVSGPFGTHQLSFTNTVSIDGYVYDELHSVTQGSFYTYPWNSGPTLTIHVREQNGVIFYRYYDTEDTLADMNAVPGDSWYAEWEQDTVASKKTVVDTGYVLVGNLKRKALFFDSAHTLAFIDRLGYNFGFFMPYHWYHSNATDIYPMYGSFKCFNDAHSNTYKTDLTWDCTLLGTGLAENNSVSIDIFPNPASYFIELSSQNPFRITLYDIAGQTMISRELSAGKQTITCEDLPRGIYVVEMQSGSGITRGKLILQ